MHGLISGKDRDNIGSISLGMTTLPQPVRHQHGVWRLAISLMTVNHLHETQSLLNSPPPILQTEHTKKKNGTSTKHNNVYLN